MEVASLSIKKKLPLIFTILVFLILLMNNSLHFFRSKQQLLDYNESQINMITQEVAFQVENAKKGSLYVEDLIGRELRTASIAIQKSLPAKHEDVTNEQLIHLANELMLSHITLLVKTEDDIVGVKSTDPHEINMGTKGWGYWYDAFEQLLALTPVNVEKGLTLPHYWSGPIEVASSNPDHVDKWGYYYDGSTNYIIDPYYRDNAVLEYEQNFGPGKIMTRFTEELEGILELTVFNPERFGDEKEVVHLNGNSYTRLSAEPIWYGSYNYHNEQIDVGLIKTAAKSGETQSYRTTLDGKDIQKTFVPIQGNHEPFVIGLVYDYGLIQTQLNEELKEHILLSFIFMIFVLIISFIFSRSITKPVEYVVERVNEIAKGDFGKTLKADRKDELGILAKNVNALSISLKTYVENLKKSNEVIEFQALHDPLTNLPNRRYFQEELTKRIEHSKRTGENVTILFIDLDRFKHLNDSLGHTKGDELLKLTANRLKEALVTTKHFITRQGGDEFIILIEKVNKVESKLLAEKIILELNKPFYLNEKKIYLNASCGISIYPEHHTEIENLIASSDMAMYSAKKDGGNKVVMFNDQISTQGKQRPLIETKLRRALEENKISVYYQPKFDTNSGKITGMEALCRWKDDELGWVSPDLFIPIAEETGLIQPLWEQIMVAACSQLSQWNKGRNSPLTLAINFSARQFQEPEQLVRQIRRYLTKYQIAPELFEIEITESTLLNHTHRTISTLHSLKEIGIHISIDDFGTGFSSLSYLKKLPIDCLKIDKSFIQDINPDFSNSEIAETIINLARSLRLHVIAEGVELEHQRDFLQSKNCTLMQGYFFSKPLSAEEFYELIQK